MRKRSIIVLALIIFLATTLVGCTPKGETSEAEERTVFLTDASYGKMKVTIWSKTACCPNYEDCIETGNKIMSNYLQDEYKECKITPFTVQEMYDYPLIPKGLQYGKKILLNIDDSMYENPEDMIVTFVHEQLHYNGRIVVPELSEEDNMTLCEYIVYGLSRKVCCAYDKETFADAEYGESPVIEQLDPFFNQLCNIYLGKEKLTKDLRQEIIKAFI